jgi:hypothetical protein
MSLKPCQIQRFNEKDCPLIYSYAGGNDSNFSLMWVTVCIVQVRVFDNGDPPLFSDANITVKVIQS